MIGTVAALAACSTVSLANSSDRTLHVDLKGKTVSRNQMGTFSVGSDRALIFLRPEHQRDLVAMQKQIGFRYLRCHGILNEEMKIVTRQPDGSLTFDWTNVDAFIDQLRAAKLKPFVELGFIPETLASGKQSIFWWRGNVTPPRDMEEWNLLVSELAKHAIQRYGRREVRSWYFEVWNEPNLDGFWTGGKDKYFELYANSARTLKKVDSRLRVGGPSTAGLAWIPEFVAYCEQNDVPLDFVSSHAYAAMQGFLDEQGKGGGTVLDTSPGTLVDGFVEARKNTPKKLPLFITEWGPSYSPRDDIHDSYVCSPFILDKVRKSEGLVDGLSYWTFSDQFEEPGPPNRPFHGGFGLMNVDGLKKPAYYAYWMVAQLYKDELPVDHKNAIVTRKGDSIRLVLWDYSPFKQDAPNSPFYHRDLPAQPLGDVSIELSNLADGTYTLRRFGTGYMRNDVYDVYRTLNPTVNGAHLSESDLETLRNVETGFEKLPDLQVRHGKGTIRLPMRTNDAWYLEVTKKN